LKDSGYRTAIELQLTSFAQRILGTVPSVQWYVEFHPSASYLLTGNLVFTPSETRELELAVN
jgi:hypothetical protein